MDSDVAQVIDRTDLIENLTNQIIEKFISPRKEAFPFFWFVLMNNSIIPLGAKVKLILSISQEVGFKIKRDPLWKVVRLRNAFAHHRTQSHPTFIVGKTPDEDDSIYVLHTFSSSMKMARIPREKALEDFTKNFISAKNTLLDS